jgi:hypothetical protein
LPYKISSLQGVKGYEQLLKARSHRSLEHFMNASLFLDQRIPKDRLGIKASVIGPPKTPSLFLFFLNCQVNQ